MSDGNLIENWIKHYETGDKALFWAQCDLDDICTSDPKRALKLITQILAAVKEPEPSGQYVLANLAAGPLEDLLARNGSKVIDEIETLARQEPRFRALLTGVWQNSMDDQLWRRVLKASNRPFPEKTKNS